MPLNAGARFRFGVFEIGSGPDEVWKRGIQIKLHAKPLQVLHALLERPGEVVSREELQRRLWPADTFVEFDNGLNNAISRLREALGDAADSPRFIETVPRRGYRFVAPVDVVGPVVAEGMPPSQSPLQRSASEPVRWRRWRPIFGLALGVAVLVSSYVILRRPAHPIDSIAVLPFVTADMAQGSADRYVAFGMTEALISALSKVAELKVISQTSTLQYTATDKPLKLIARELGVGAVVEGSVVHEGDQVRITVQLIDAASDTHLWTETYRPAAANVLAVQGTLAQSMVEEIQLRLTGAPAGRITATREPDPLVREMYLKGRYFMRSGSEDDMGRARGYFEQAVAADPDYAAAYAGLADYYTLTDSLPPADAFDRARANARKAIALEDDLADARASLAYVYYYGDWNWADAEREFQRAISLDPSNSRARRRYARFLGTMGRHAEAAEHMERALALDPLSTSTHADAAAQWFHSRVFGRMIEAANKIRELDPRDNRAYEHLAIAYLYTDRHAEGRSAVEHGRALSPREPLFVMLAAIAEARQGHQSEAAHALGDLEALGEESYVPPTFLAVAYGQLGRRDQALEQLEVGYRGHDPYLVLIRTSPWFDPLRGDRRFEDLLRRMNFPPASQPASPAESR
jgi:TolB-like protein/DNA-binding winged helix-turn-helix (wHTH) protein/tetratricopeptide (TPR) repeat protein